MFCFREKNVGKDKKLLEIRFNYIVIKKIYYLNLLFFAE